MDQHRNWIAGSARGATGGATLDSYDPATGEPWVLVARSTSADVDEAVAAARAGVRLGHRPAPQPCGSWAT